MLPLSRVPLSGLLCRMWKQSVLLLLGHALGLLLSRRTTDKAEPSRLGSPSHREAGCRTHTKAKPFSLPNPKHNQTQKMGDRGKGSRTENVYFHAQGCADLADSSTTGPRRKAMSDEARPCARRAARTRPVGGSGHGHESGRQELEAPMGYPGSDNRGRKQRTAGYDCTLSAWAERWWCQSRRRV